MDLKEFITQTVNSIVSASQELSKEHSASGVIINPPTGSSATENYFEYGSSTFNKRRVQNVEFDVALTSGSTTTVEGEASGKLFVASAQLVGEHSRSSESISRVRFVIPLALPASQAEEDNREKMNKDWAKPPTVRNG